LIPEQKHHAHSLVVAYTARKLKFPDSAITVRKIKKPLGKLKSNLKFEIV
jgi:hypothetical protein